GESTKETVKPLRGESRDVSAVPVVLPPCALLLHTGYGRSQRPAFPAPSLQGRDNEIAKPEQNRAAGMRTAISASLRGAQRRSNPALLSRQRKLDCFASLAMTWMSPCFRRDDIGSRLPAR